MPLRRIPPIVEVTAAAVAILLPLTGWAFVLAATGGGL